MRYSIPKILAIGLASASLLLSSPINAQTDTTEVDNEADSLFQNMTERDIEEAVKVLDSLSQNTDIELVPLPSRN